MMPQTAGTAMESFSTIRIDSATPRRRQSSRTSMASPDSSRGTNCRSRGRNRQLRGDEPPEEQRHPSSQAIRTRPCRQGRGLGNSGS